MNGRTIPAAARLALALAVAAAWSLLAGAVEHTKDPPEAILKALAEKKAVLIDVREQFDWEKGHLRDARSLPLSKLTGKVSPAELQAVLPKDRVIYAHCAAGVRCLKAAEVLKAHGYEVRPIKEGYRELLKVGFPKAD
jgi:rhodanese-related sulfurtransferase